MKRTFPGSMMALWIRVEDLFLEIRFSKIFWQICPVSWGFLNLWDSTNPELRLDKFSLVLNHSSQTFKAPLQLFLWGKSLENYHINLVLKCSKQQWGSIQNYSLLKLQMFDLKISAPVLTSDKLVWVKAGCSSARHCNCI